MHLADFLIHDSWSGAPPMFFRADSVTLNAPYTTGKSDKIIFRSTKIIGTLPRIVRRGYLVVCTQHKGSLYILCSIFTFLLLYLQMTLDTQVTFPLSIDQKVDKCIWFLKINLELNIYTLTELHKPFPPLVMMVTALPWRLEICTWWHLSNVKISFFFNHIKGQSLFLFMSQVVFQSRTCVFVLLGGRW